MPQDAAVDVHAQWFWELKPGCFSPFSDHVSRLIDNGWVHHTSPVLRVDSREFGAIDVNFNAMFVAGVPGVFV